MHTPDARRNPRVSRAVIATTESPTCAAASGAFERFGNAALPSWLDEQYTLMSLWSIARSPLMFGGNLPQLDDFTKSLVTNDEIIDAYPYLEPEDIHQALHYPVELNAVFRGFYA